MNEQLERLIELQRIDSKILIINRSLKDFPIRLAEAEDPLRESENMVNAIKQKLDLLEKRKRDKEMELDITSEKINKVKARTTDIKTNKEYQALLKEIESIEKERSSVEDQILLIMEEIETVSDQIKLGKQKIGIDKAKVEDLKKKIDSERVEVEKELLRLKDIRSKVAQAMDGETYDQYISLIEACNGLAVTEAREEICQGCNMNIPPQLFVEIKKNEEIINCPQCRRILYFKDSTP